MIKPLPAASRPRRAQVGVAGKSAVAPLPAPNRIAFVGTGSASSAKGQGVLVQALCWPLVPMTWAALTQEWQSMRAGRAETTGTETDQPSWIRACAPQLGMPFRDTLAEE